MRYQKKFVFLQRETYKQKGNDMSTATLNGLRDYLYDTLSPANLIWLGKQLTEYGYMQEKPQKPYTKEELKARIELSERQFAEGKYQDFDEAMDELEEEFAEDEKVRLIAKYIRKEFGKKRRDEFIQEVRQTRRLIEQSPNIGPVEPLLEELPAMYRSYVMNGLNKMVYRIEDDTIYIVDFWDVRQDPSTLAERNI